MPFHILRFGLMLYDVINYNNVTTAKCSQEYASKVHFTNI